ncbi:MAG: YchF/TatD family DNA exonuclease [Nitrospinae bacterium]|nr:YchF/TatD family DNA exonuclease [Nitrospinota bacterium]
MPADSHCHLNDPAFDNDREETIARAKEAGVSRILNVGYSIPNSEKAVELAQKHPYMSASAGIHPHDAKTVDGSVIEKLRGLARLPEIVAIGETGLDYYRDKSPRDVQQKSFRSHIAIAREAGKPVIVHCRDAMDDAIKVLTEENVKEIGGVMHCFAGTPEDARRCLDLNLYISFAGNITYPKAEDLRRSLAATPGHRLLLETDAPYLSPQKLRGKRNEPSAMTYIVKQAAQTRGVTVEDIERITLFNFEELFGAGGKGEGEIAYKIRNSLYLNVTIHCTNECYFCPRFGSRTVQGHDLRISGDPSAEEMIALIGDPKRYDEVVFCGYGEPTIRLEQIKAVARHVKDNGGVTRLNTNGHGSHIAGRDIVPELVGLIDHVSVSLNAADPATYNAICQPAIPEAWEKTVEFIKSAKGRIPNVTATVVAIPGKVDVAGCEKFARETLGVDFRVRAFDLVG